ncbi:MAG: beta-ureidopropionase / N-carbamoyl-L-amino-acid hydrolase [Methylobacteriaceae bacterium]|nr:beta-ureidopropionase / N-carbamoyl-L-amino-acid hydrolase [Methylobacteriaceae bacterium]
MKASNLPVNQDRLWEDLMTLAEITESDRPYTRRSFTPMFLKGRDWIKARFEAAGLATRIDTAGNLIGRRAGARPGKGTIVIGSHSDTVPSGGRFDGTAGVMAGLEVARALQEAGHDLDHDLEIIDCLAEEVSAFGISCVGSRAIAGGLTDAMLSYQGPGGERLAQAIVRVGGDPQRLAEAKRSDIAAFLELHIEQGPVLETEHIDVGVVQTIAGITRLELTITGRADHAGTTPFDLRSDALIAAARAILAIQDIARELGRSGDGYFVATTGEIYAEPNAANVVPGRVKLVIDARAECRPTMERFVSRIKEEMPSLVTASGAELSAVGTLSDAPPARGDAGLCVALADAAEKLGLTHRPMTSGAGHDAVHFSRIAPAAMVFTPCRGGRSHCPEEWAEPGEIAAGAATILNAVLAIDRARADAVRE